MNDSIYKWYCSTKKLIKDLNEHATDETDEIINAWKESIETMEIACPGIKEKYDRITELRQSFSSEKIDYICSMIDEWYLEWKDKMVIDSMPNQHRLGIAKENLKIMICGD